MSNHADIVLHGGRIATLDPLIGMVEAVAIRDGFIVAAGKSVDCLNLKGPKTTLIPLQDAFVMPGINDSHCHPDGQAVKAGRWDDLSTGLHSITNLLDRIAACSRLASQHGWYLGFRLDENDIGGYPSREMLDSAAAGRPVFLMRRDAHVGVASSAALALLRASGASMPEHCLDEQSGMVHGRGVFAFTTLIAAQDSVADYLEGFPALFRDMARLGITSVHNALTSRLAVQAYRHLHAQQALPVRVGMMLNGRDLDLVDETIEAGLRFGQGDSLLHLLGVEYGSDGSTSGRTAAYYAPYVGQEDHDGTRGNYGDLNFTAQELTEKVKRIMQAGLQVAVTGNGDRGIDFALDAFEQGLKATPEAIRPRIEHCCCARPEAQARMAQLGVINSSAAGFLYNLGDAYLRNRPQADEPWFWPHRSMLDKGVLVCGHSDAPVCERNPFYGIGAMVTRKTASGARLNADQAISVEEAIRCYTVSPAIAEGQGVTKGTLAPGRVADLIVLDRDLYAIDAEQIRETQVLTTIVGGRPTFCSPEVIWATDMKDGGE
jgi:predicted amidohydrolase YtcJ